MNKKPYGFLTIPGLITSTVGILVVFGVGMMRGEHFSAPVHLTPRLARRWEG